MLDNSSRGSLPCSTSVTFCRGLPEFYGQFVAIIDR